MAEDDDLSAWLLEIETVQPISVEKVAETAKGIPDATQRANVLAQRSAAVVDERGYSTPLTLGWVERVGPRDILGFKREGIQAAVYKKLRLGQYPCQAVLDLHGKRLVEASQAVYDFLTDQYAAGHRTVRIVHGRGLRSQTEPALLKRYCAHWLKTLAWVNAYHSAQPRDGGAGALYVLLKKNPERKATNRQRHDSRLGS